MDALVQAMSLIDRQALQSYVPLRFHE